MFVSEHSTAFALPKWAEGFCTEKDNDMIVIPPVHHNFFHALNIEGEEHTAQTVIIRPNQSMNR